MRISQAIAGLCLLVGCATPSPSRVETLPYFDSAEFTPRWLDPESVPEDFHHIPTFSFTNQRGETIDQSALDGKVAVVDFFFASCSGICPKLRSSMVRIEAAFEPHADLVLLSHSVTPGKDTVEVLAAYAAKNNITSPRWHLLTGDRQSIYTLGREAYFAEDDLGKETAESDFLHTENIVLLDRHRRVRGVYSGLNQTAVAQLITDATTLMSEP